MREFNAARRYSGKGVARSDGTAAPPGLDVRIGGALADVLVKELEGTTGRRLVRGMPGGLFRGR